MGMSRCYSLMKCLLIIFSIIFLCVGSGACGFAAWALWEGRGGESAAERAGLCALATWGGALALGALAALCGAIRRSALLLAGAFSLLALSAVGSAGAAWWGAAHGDALRAALRAALAHAVRHEYGAAPARTQLLDVIQHELQCCGADGPRDWQGSAWARTRDGAGHGDGDEQGQGTDAVLDLSVGAPATYYWVPESCCVAPGSACEASRRVVSSAGGAGAGAGLHGAACGPRVLAALRGLARAPLCAAGALLAAHALALPLTLALWLHASPHTHHKA